MDSGGCTYHSMYRWRILTIIHKINQVIYASVNAQRRVHCIVVHIVAVVLRVSRAT